MFVYVVFIFETCEWRNDCCEEEIIYENKIGSETK